MKSCIHIGDVTLVFWNKKVSSAIPPHQKTLVFAGRKIGSKHGTFYGPTKYLANVAISLKCTPSRGIEVRKMFLVN